MRKLGWALAFHRDELEMGGRSLRNPAAAPVDRNGRQLGSGGWWLGWLETYVVLAAATAVGLFG